MSKAASAAPPRKKLRQAAESDGGKVSVLCFSCRRTEDKTTQQGIASFFKAPAATADGTTDKKASEQQDEALFCSRCRRSMEKKVADRTGSGGGQSRVLPQIARLRQYQRLAADQHVPFAIGEAAATALMREACVACGTTAPTEGHGLTRMRVWPEGLARPARGGFMGPFHTANLAPACGTCNLMKGFRSVRGYVEACRHIATHRSQFDYGRYPHRFRNNTSRRCRSAYISASSTHSKTHALSNEAFARLVARPCRYCGKASDPPRHHNGLDRLDSSVRVYTEESCDSCCGDCNVMKYTWSEEVFLAHCVKVAQFNVGRDAFPGAEAEELGWSGDEEEEEQVQEQEQEDKEEDEGEGEGFGSPSAEPDAPAPADRGAGEQGAVAGKEEEEAAEEELGPSTSRPNQFSAFAFSGTAAFSRRRPA